MVSVTGPSCAPSVGKCRHPYRKSKTVDVTLRIGSAPVGYLCGLIGCAIAGLFRSRAALQAEILVFRDQLNILRRIVSRKRESTMLYERRRKAPSKPPRLQTAMSCPG
jgi:hypothetical protein